MNRISNSLLQSLSEFSVQWDEDYVSEAVPCPGVYFAGGDITMNLAYYSHGKFFISPNIHDSSKPLHIIDLGTKHKDIVVSSDYFGVGHWSPAVYKISTSELIIYVGKINSSLVKRLTTLLRSRGNNTTCNLETYTAIRKVTDHSKKRQSIDISQIQSNIDSTLDTSSIQGDLDTENDLTDTLTDISQNNEPNTNKELLKDEYEEEHVRLVVSLNGKFGDIPVPRCYIASEKKDTHSIDVSPISNKLSQEDRTNMSSFSNISLRSQFALFRPSKSTYYIFTDIFNTKNFKEISFGDSNDIPVPADYLGKNTAQLANYRPSTGEWFILHELDQYAECTVLVTPTSDSSKLETKKISNIKCIPMPYFFQGKSYPAVWNPSEKIFIICNNLKEWENESIIKDAILCDNVYADDLPILFPNNNVSNIGFAKKKSKWIFNQIREISQ